MFSVPDKYFCIELCDGKEQAQGNHAGPGFDGYSQVEKWVIQSLGGVEAIKVEQQHLPAWGGGMCGKSLGRSTAPSKLNFFKII